MIATAMRVEYLNRMIWRPIEAQSFVLLDDGRDHRADRALCAGSEERKAGEDPLHFVVPAADPVVGEGWGCCGLHRQPNGRPLLIERHPRLPRHHTTERVNSPDEKLVRGRRSLRAYWKGWRSGSSRTPAPSSRRGAQTVTPH